MVSNQRTYLAKLREKGSEEPHATLTNLDTLITQYPYFQALRYLGWEIASNQNEDNKESLKTLCSLHTKNRLHLIPNPTAVEDVVQVATEVDTTNEVRTFVEWLQGVDTDPSLKKEEDRLIDKFINDSPRIIVSKSNKITKDLTEKQRFDEHALMTETLAEVYFKQGKLKKAKKAYEILALKYPEKSGFFADQIRKITNVKNET